MTQQSLNGSVRRKCLHDCVEITEYGTSTTLHMRNGITGEWEHDSDFGYYTGSIAVYCPECGYTGRYTSRRPKWIQRALGDATGTDWKKKWPDSRRKERNHE